MSRAVIAAALVGCAGPPPAPPDPGLEGLSLTAVEPAVVVPGSRIVLTGTSFVPDAYGTARWRLRGGGVDLALPARFVDYQTLEVSWPGEPIAELDGAATWVEFDSAIDGGRYASEPIAIRFASAARLTPRLDEVTTGAVIRVNEPLAVRGGGFLLGGDEGQTVAIFDGCYQPDASASCAPIEPRQVEVVVDGSDRDSAAVAFVPEIADTIATGRFRGQVFLENHHGPLAGSAATASDAAPLELQVIEPAIHAISSDRASLGQWIDISGGGFAGDVTGDRPPQSTLLEIAGTFTPAGGPARAIDLTLVATFVAGPLVRYPLTEQDELGEAIDLRRESGTLSGTVTPVVLYRDERVAGSPVAFSFEIAPVAQIAWLRFRPGYVEELRSFGLRAVDREIRARITAVIERDYAGINLVLRDRQPLDFSLFSEVEISGVDPTRRGLFGLDNSAGRDVGNLRLFDKIGGAQSEIQDDGAIGYGGVFARSFFSFSEHPGDLAAASPLADPLFDALFDPFRPDRGGVPVSAGDLASSLPEVGPGDCPAVQRPAQIACAIYALGSMIGSTTGHEIAHSLGLANPGDVEAGPHLPGDRPGRLMDSGAQRPFAERAELEGAGPARFCAGEYQYLRAILPASDGAAVDPEALPPCD